MPPTLSNSAPDDARASDAWQAEMTCPTCGARQQPADVCRRCQCDLRLVREMHERLRRMHTRCLALVRQRRLRRALEVAERCVELCPCDDTLRLLAVCHLMAGDFKSAYAVGASLDT